MSQRFIVADHARTIIHRHPETGTLEVEQSVEVAKSIRKVDGDFMSVHGDTSAMMSTGNEAIIRTLYGQVREDAQILRIHINNICNTVALTPATREALDETIKSLEQAGEVVL